MFAVATLTLGALVPGEVVNAQGPPANVGPAVLVEGELEVLYEDASTGSRLLYFLETVTGGRMPLRFRGVGPDLPSGSRVRVTGNLAEGAVTPTSVTTIAVTPSRTLGEQKVLVILFNFANNSAQPYEPTAADSVNAQVRDFYLENSYQQTEMNFAVTGWHTIAATNTTCDYSAWASQADAAATAAGFDVTAYARRIYAFPETNACAWWGMGNVGGPRSWINGTYNTRVVAHEQGHNFGNRHSHASKCDANGCVSVDYGDDRDVLGAGGVVGHMNAFQKERLGWLNYESAPIIEEPTASGDYWIDNYEAVAGGRKGLKIWNAAAGNFFYVEARERVGFDAGLPPGVVLHTGAPSNSDSSYQLDLAPTTSAWDSTLDVGQTFVDAAVGVSIMPLSSDVNGALVRVTFDAQPCVGNAPSVTFSPSSQTGAPGTTLQYTMMVTNNNPGSCAPAPMAFSATMPAGWSASFSPASASVATGATISTTLSVTAPPGSSGTHSFTASALDTASGLPAYGTASATIVGALDVTTTATVTRSRNSSYATLNVAVKNGGQAVSGANVIFTVTKPTGATSTLAATTNTSGVANVKYSLRSKDPSGIYQVRAQATANGITGSATTTFQAP